MELEDNIALVFKNKSGDIKKLELTVKDMLERDLEYFYEDLEEGCTSSGCNTESNNFCECGPDYADYEIDHLEIIKTI